MKRKLCEFLDFLEVILSMALAIPIICIIFLISKITNKPIEEEW